MLSVPNSRDSMGASQGQVRESQGNLHYVVSVTGQFVEIHLGEAGEDLPDFHEELG